MKNPPSPVQTVVLTGLTLCAFAANSLLTRMALGGGAIDTASFTTLRLGSGAAMLLAICHFTQVKQPNLATGSKRPHKWPAALMLFLYAVTFSFAYLQMATGTGALILFGTVQVTMILVALKEGEKPVAWEWVGLLLALVGLVYLVSPGLAAPPLGAAALMGVAGIAWGIYSLLGRGSTDPIANTAGNFVRAVPFAAGVSCVSWQNFQLSQAGIVLALLSGAIASGVGYSLWYSILRALTATRAATLQLSVPVIAAAGGIVFLQEAMSLRLAIAAVMILGGIGIATLGRKR
ncbi:MAG: DMT family transporter [Cyanobacteria bacterium J06626_6]